LVGKITVWSLATAIERGLELLTGGENKKIKNSKRPEIELWYKVNKGKDPISYFMIFDINILKEKLSFTFVEVDKVEINCLLVEYCEVKFWFSLIRDSSNDWCPFN
jgi:hypothetical protein